MERVFLSLRRLSEEHQEVFMCMTQLQFGEYLGHPCYAAAAAHLPLPFCLPPTCPATWTRGDFDVLIIHRHYGLVVCEVKAFGDNVQDLKMTDQQTRALLRDKLMQAAGQLDKAEAMLSFLVSDVAPGLRVSKALAFPNLTTARVHSVISADPLLEKELCRCLNTSDATGIMGLCLWSNLLSAPTTPWEISSVGLRELWEWWQRRVIGNGPEQQMTLNVYETLVARFCGPATTVTVPCISACRISLKTPGHAVSQTGEACSAVALFPEQFHLLQTAPPRGFLCGPPGTGKTVVLQLMGTEWLRLGRDVHIVSTWKFSYSACSMLRHLLQQAVRRLSGTGVTRLGKLHLLQYDMYKRTEVDKAVTELRQAARGGTLCVLADEAGPDDWSKHFARFCDQLLSEVPGLHLWAASYQKGHAPATWHMECLTRPLRCPPNIVREIAKSEEISSLKDVPTYSDRGVPDHTDGVPIKWIYHLGQGHNPDELPLACVQCGNLLAEYLRSLRVGLSDAIAPKDVSASSTANTSREAPTPPALLNKDVLVLSSGPADDSMGFVRGLRGALVPVRVASKADRDDVATAASDVVWVTGQQWVRGLERKVVVCVENIAKSYSECNSETSSYTSKIDVISDRLNGVSRCTSQLVMVIKKTHEQIN